MSSEVSSISLSLIETKAKLYLRLDHSNPISNNQHQCWMLYVGIVCAGLYMQVIYTKVYILYLNNISIRHINFTFSKLFQQTNSCKSWKLCTVQYIGCREIVFGIIHWT